MHNYRLTNKWDAERKKRGFHMCPTTHAEMAFKNNEHRKALQFEAKDVIHSIPLNKLEIGTSDIFFHAVQKLRNLNETKYWH